MSEPNYHCPVCGTVSTIIVGPTQAMCSNEAEGPEGCPVLFFNPSLPDGGLSNPQFGDLDGGPS